MRKVALLCVGLAGCAGHVPPVEEVSLARAEGCWEFTSIKNRFVPQPTTIRLDTALSVVEPGYRTVERVTLPPNRVLEEKNYWYISPNEQRVMIRLGGFEDGTLLNLTLDKNTLRAGGVVAKRTSCPASNSVGD